MRRFLAALVLLALIGGVAAWAGSTTISKATNGQLHNCPQANKWSIATWDGADGTSTEQAMAACGEGSIDMLYWLDPDSQGWKRYISGRPEVSNLNSLDDHQGVLALGSATGPSASPSLTPTVSATPTPIAGPLHSFSGHGQEATSPFHLDEGLVIVRLSHTGSSNFIVHLLDSHGDTVEWLVNEIGQFDGSTAFGTETAGNYVLDIAADGSWTVDIEAPRPTSAPSAPQTFSGSGPAATPFFYLEDTLTTFEMTHNGDSNFIVHLLDSDGDTVAWLVNEIGSFDGSTATGLPASGIYLLDVEADGNWTVRVEQ
jgi:hypothetical protein